MKTLSIISHKGGAGKTSSAVMIAEDFARRGLRVVLIDADRQRGAGLLLGIEQATGLVQQTKNPKLRYFCASSIPLRELPLKAQELSQNFDVGVVDTPSLDDPLARTWIQLSTDVLLVMPVEPISLKTLEGADTAIEHLQRLNEDIRIAGVLPTLFDENDTTQRSLLLELRSRRPEGLLPVIPLDQGLVHRAEQRAERRTEAAEGTRLAYAGVGDALVRTMQLNGATPVAPVASGSWKAARPAAPAPPVGAGRGNPSVHEAMRRAQGTPAPAGGMNWSLVAIAALVFLLVVGAGWALGLARGKASGTSPVPAGKSAHAAPARVSTAR
jgi:cellulose biosynthesis protein BcsQ